MSGAPKDETFAGGYRAAGAWPETLKGINKYINTELTPNEERFRGEQNPKETFVKLWDKLEPMHLAPVSQINYAQKISMVTHCLAGNAERIAMGYQDAKTRREYLGLWKLLHDFFGDPKAEAFMIYQSMLRREPTQDSGWQQHALYINEMASYAKKVERLGGTSTRHIR